MAKLAIKQALTELLAKRKTLKLAILFGSHATETAGPDSDIDVAVLDERPLTAADKEELIREIAYKFGRPVDLIDLYTVGEPLLGQIFKGQRLLGDDNSYAKLLTRHLIDSVDFLPLRQRILKERRDSWIQ